MKISIYRAMGLALICFLIFSGCARTTPTPSPAVISTQTQVEQEPTQQNTEIQPTETIPETEPKHAEEVVIGIGRDLYYGHTQWHMIHGSLRVWEPLIYPDENMNPQPFLATSWEHNPEMTEWTFHLREGVSFHDGTPLTADIAVQNLLGTHENYTPLPNLDKIEVDDPASFTIYLTKPTPALPDLLVFFQSAMLSPASWEQDDVDEPIPYGTGPFRFVDYVDGERIILERNENYWGDSAETERIIYQFIPDSTTRLQALQSGEIDAIADVGSIIPSQGEIIESDESLNLYTVDVLTTHYLFFNNDKPPFDNQTLRQAVSLAIDRELIVNETVYGYGVPGESLVTQLATQWVNPDASPEFDSQKAQELAQSVLGDEQVGVTFVLNSGLANRWPYAEIAQIIQFELSDLGFDVEIQTVEGGTWNEMLANDEYDISMRPYTMSSGDPDDFMTYWARSDGIFNKNYSISYQDDQVQAMIEQAVSEVDQTARKALYDEIQAILIEQAPFTPIYHEVTLYATRDTVFDLTLDALFRPSLDTVYKLVE
jgi:peptide/nickel transport system substrate-binding protein